MPNSLNYRSNEEPEIRPSKPYRLRTKIIFVVLVCFSILLWMQFNGQLFIDPRFRSSKVLGKTPSEIISVFGPPAADSRKDEYPPGDKNNFVFVYFVGFQNVIIHF